jgi:acyl-CoA synthetase (AMP-forming)/AMP-acid ligase II
MTEPHEGRHTAVNLTMLLDMAVDGFGDRVVVGSRNGGLTPAHLRELARGAAKVVLERDADAIVYLAVNGPAFQVALFAAAYSGVPLVPVNYRLGGEQIDQLLANHPKAYAIVDQRDAGTVARAGLSSVTPEEWLLIAETSDGGETEPVVTEAPAVIIYTSGTTSAPKGVLLRHDNLASYVLGTVEFAAADPEEAALVSVPPYHIAGVSNALTNLFTGRRVLVLEHFNERVWLDLVRTERVTHAMVVPTMLARIMDAEDVDRSVPTLRSLSYGGAKMPSRVIAKALQEWPHVNFVNAYGLTETSSTVTLLGPEDHRAALASDDPAVRARLGSAGRAVPGIEIEIRDAAGAPVPPGTSGIIWIRGEQVSGEYAGTGTAVDAHGFFCTRDKGWLDEEGYLFIEGRMDDTIIRGAENIAPAEIEDVLMRHPQVIDAVVVGVPDDEWGQRIEAAVVVRPGSHVLPEELREYVRAHLRGSKTPDRIAVWPELPRTVTGKLIRRDVVTRLLDET